jgi:hypothetical protein
MWKQLITGIEQKEHSCSTRTYSRRGSGRPHDAPHVYPNNATQSDKPFQVAFPFLPLDKQLKNRLRQKEIFVQREKVPDPAHRGLPFPQYTSKQKNLLQYKIN